MNHLLTCGDINGIPYQCFYLSSNLDHALYNKLNLDDEAKAAYANAFYEKFLGREKLWIPKESGSLSELLSNQFFGITTIAALAREAKSKKE